MEYRACQGHGARASSEKCRGRPPAKVRGAGAERQKDRSLRGRRTTYAGREYNATRAAGKNTRGTETGRGQPDGETPRKTRRESVQRRDEVGFKVTSHTSGHSVSVLCF